MVNNERGKTMLRRLILVGCVTAFICGGTGAAAFAVKPPKEDRYHLNVFDEFGTLAAEYTAYLTPKTHRWRVVGLCDAGPYTKTGKYLDLIDECQPETLYLERVKHKSGVWYGFGSYAFFELIKQ